MLSTISFVLLIAFGVQFASIGDAFSASTSTHEKANFLPTVVSRTHPPGPAPNGMVWIPGGEFSMGTADPRGTEGGGMLSMEDARPIHRVYVDGFWIDKTDVTNEEFAQFVKATGYVTIAERVPTKEEFPTAPPENLIAGSVVYSPTAHAVELNNYMQWWSYVPGADWRHPEGPNSSIADRMKHPVVQVCWDDAVAYCMQTYRSYDPGSGTYMGNDGYRHPCP